MKFKRLLKAEEIEAFKESFESAIGASIPLDYYLKSEVLGLYKNKKMIGGFCTSPQHNMRWKKMIPANKVIQPVGNNKANRNENEIIELNCVWLHSKYRCSWEGFYFWMWLSRYLSAMKDKTIVAFYNSSNKGMEKIYSKVYRGIIYDGPTEKGTCSFESICIYWTDSQLYSTFFFRYFPELISRLFKVKILKFKFACKRFLSRKKVRT